MSAKSFSTLLILCDDAQEWGRKSISELYVNKTIEYEYDGLNIDLSKASIKVLFSERFKNIDKNDDVSTILHRFVGISSDYNEIFRDGLETSKRDFCFEKKTIVESGTGNNKVTINLLLKITNEDSSKINVSLDSTNTNANNFKAIEKIVNKLFKIELNSEKRNGSTSIILCQA